VPHHAEVERECREAYEQGRPTIPVEPGEPHWEVGYVAVLESGGAYNGHSYEPRSVEIRHPLGWMSLPEPSEAMRRIVRAGSYL